MVIFPRELGAVDRSAEPRSEMTTTGAEPPSAEAAPPSRTERRKALTRQKLIDAARAMLADGTAADASIQQITERADVGFGSFYNHFPSKAELFEAAVTDVLEELGALFDQLSVDVEDAALAYAQSTRLILRLCRSRPRGRPRCSSGTGCTTWKPSAAWPPACCATCRPGWRRAGSAPPSPAGPSRALRGGAGHAADGADASRARRRRRL